MVGSAGVPPHDPLDADRLTGWKEIASFLGKGVRTVQRWEKDYGLPVHRIGREGGEIIFASRREITTWLDHGAGRDTRADHQAMAPSGTDPGRRRTWTFVGAFAVVLAAIGVWAFTRPLPNPGYWRVQGNQLLVYGDQSDLIFSFAFDYPPEFDELSYSYRSGGTGVIEDIDGDGTREVLFCARNGARDPSTAFYILNADGTVRARIRPEHQVSFGETRYAPPWLPYRVFVNRRPGRAPAIHVVFIHGQNYPTLLLEIDAQGNTIGEYWSNGYVNQVEYIHWRGTDVLAVGAANNDFQGSSLALFESGHAVGSAPARRDAYRCTTCARGSGLEPSAFIVFPRRCLSESINGTGSGGDIWTDATGSLFVGVEEGGIQDSGRLKSVATYVLDADLNFLRVEPHQGFFTEHEAWCKEGRIDHPVSREHDGPLFFPVRVWHEDGFVDLPPAPVDWSQFDTAAGGR